MVKLPAFVRCVFGNLALVLFCWGLLATSAFAQKAPALGYVYPPVVQVGKATEVQFGGYDFTEDMQWFVHDPRIKLATRGVPSDYHLPPPPYWFGPRASLPAMPIPREVAGTLEVSADMPAGSVRWQVANANGASAPAMLYLSRGEEVLEKRSRDFPQKLTSYPVGVSGRLSRLTEVDTYEIVAKKDGIISVDLLARRLGADFLGVLKVLDDAGNTLADFADTEGKDGGVSFAVQNGRTYTIRVSDVDFRGDRAFVYHLQIHDGPRVSAMFPAMGKRGTSAEVTFFGLGIASGKPVMESFKQVVNFPADAAATTFRHSITTPAGVTEVEIPLTDLPQRVLENGAAGFALEGSSGVTASLGMGTDEHRYTWKAEANDFWTLDLQSRGIGGSLDVGLTVIGPDGKVVADSDDLPGTTDAGLEFKAAAAGEYIAVVRSAASRQGAVEEFYHLAVQKQMPQFALTVPPIVLLPSAGKVELPVTVQRLGGHDAEIALTVEGLPAGVTFEGETKVAMGKGDHKLVLQAAANAAVVASSIIVRGTSKVGDAMVTQVAVATVGGNLAPRSKQDSRMPQSLLVMTMAAPFEVQVVDRERQRDVHRGTTYLAELDIVRKPGFQGEIVLEMTAQQDRYRQGTKGPRLVVPANATKAYYPCFLPEWCATDLTRRIVVHGVAAVPDPQGKPRLLTKAGDARITMILEGALLKLSVDAKEMMIAPGQTLELPVVISRSVKLPLPTTVTLDVPEELVGILEVEPLQLPPGQDAGLLRVKTTADAKLLGPWQFTITATALQEGKWPVISQTVVPVQVTDRPASIPENR
ncbi:MAG: PPC domain-containing protein [Planctomycetaceae bacterium]